MQVRVEKEVTYKCFIEAEADEGPEMELQFGSNDHMQLGGHTYLQLNPTNYSIVKVFQPGKHRLSSIGLDKLKQLREKDMTSLFSVAEQANKKSRTKQAQQQKATLTSKDITTVIGGIEVNISILTAKAARSNLWVQDTHIGRVLAYVKEPGFYEPRKYGVSMPNGYHSTKTGKVQFSFKTEDGKRKWKTVNDLEQAMHVRQHNDDSDDR